MKHRNKKVGMCTGQVLNKAHPPSQVEIIQRCRFNALSKYRKRYTWRNELISLEQPHPIRTKSTPKVPNYENTVLSLYKPFSLDAPLIAY